MKACSAYPFYLLSVIAQTGFIVHTHASIGGLMLNFPKVAAGPHAGAGGLVKGYCMLMVKPLAPRLKLTPSWVARMSRTTPFWFRARTPLGPPAMAIPPVIPT
jgi:hypothetical protein